MSHMSVEEKIRIIEASQSFADIPPSAFPPSHKENYYFVSYSHKDYKRVFKDILRLEEMGINIWYDSEMHIGENWQEIAEMYISKFQCAGVIFYLSENSISSPACNQEVEYVLTHNKDFFSINIPLDGCGVQSGHAMLCELKRRGLKCDDRLLENFQKAFSDQILYLSVDETIEKKAHQIAALKHEELLGLSKCFSHAAEGEGLEVTSCRDNTLINIDLSKIHDADGITSPIISIGDCVFTNSIKLQSVRLSDRLERIGESAFRNCTALREIAFPGKTSLWIADHAFQGCSSLGEMDLSRASYIGDEAFCDCPHFETTCISGTVGARAFKGSAVREILCNSPHLKASAFEECGQLKRVDIHGTFSNGLEPYSFAECKKMKHAGPFVAPPSFSSYQKTPLEVGYRCFYNCEALEEVLFRGIWAFSDAESVFQNCKSLQRIEMDVVGTIIPKNFARACTSLTEVVVSAPVTEVGEAAFAECPSLKVIDLSALETVGRNAFWGTAIERLYLKKIKEIPHQAFAEMHQLESLTIGADCGRIEDCAFLGCESLRTVKILSETAVLANYKRTFMRTAIEVFYLRSRAVYDTLVEDGALATLRVLYVGLNLADDELAPEGFDRVESDVSGFMKFTRGEELLQEDREALIESTNAELNEPDPYREHFVWDRERDLELLGHEVAIKHSRLKKPRTYFVEDVVYQDEDVLDYLQVSVHTGVSFRLDATLIESIEPSEFHSADWFETDKPEGLDGKDCCITANGERHYCNVLRTEYFSVWGVPMPNQRLKYPIKVIYCAEESRIRAISSLDIESIVVFNDRFEVEQVLKRTPRDDQK